MGGSFFIFLKGGCGADVFLDFVFLVGLWVFDGLACFVFCMLGFLGGWV